MSQKLSVAQAFIRFLLARPWPTFLSSFVILVCLVILSNYLTRPASEEAPPPAPPPLVSVFDPSALYLATWAQVDNQGIVNVVVQNPGGGVVQKINVKPGQKVSRGQTLVSLATNYQGGNVPALQLQLAEKNWLMTHANWWDQLDADDLNQALAHHNLQQSGNSLTNYREEQQHRVIDTNVVMTDRLQQLNLDTAESQFFQAQIAASLMAPATPIAGTVEKVNFSLGQVVSAGQVVATIRSSNQPVRLVVPVGESTIAHLNPLLPAIFKVGEATHEARLDYLPTTPGSAGDYELAFTLPAELGQKLAPKAYLPLQLPLIIPQSQIVVPLSAVYQTQDAAYTYILAYDETGAAIAKQEAVVLGAVVGEYVFVQQGLSATDQVLMENNLLNGQKVSLKDNS